MSVMTRAKDSSKAATSPCPICGAVSASSMLRYRPYARCGGCELVRNLEPKAVSANFYGDEYFTVEDHKSGSRDFLSEWSERYDDARFFTELDELGPPPRNGRLLDVGAATGGYVRRAAQRGWTVVGMEVSEEARRIAGGGGISMVSTLELALGEGPFDVITLHHVLEHLATPLEDLRTLKSGLAPGGRLLIEVPNWASLERIGAGPEWVDLRPEQHLWHFEPRTLRLLCEKAGLHDATIFTKSEPIPTPGSVLGGIGVPLKTLKRLASFVKRSKVDVEEAASPNTSGNQGVFGAAAIARFTDVWLRRTSRGKRLVALYSLPAG